MVPVLSIVIPAYNEEGCLAELLSRLKPVLESLGAPYEIIFIDDGSRDRTYSLLCELAQKYPEIAAVRLSRNFGHQAALTAGLTLARGQAVISMDADLQHPPELIPQMVDLWKQGNQVVATIRTETRDADASKKLTSTLFYKLINLLSPMPIIPGAADFRLLDRCAVDALNSMPEKTRFLRGLIPWIGFKQTQIPFSAPERFAGKSQYSYRKMVSFALNGILSLSAFPLRLASIIGLGVLFIGVVYGIYVVWTALTNTHSQPGWASVILVLLLLGGMQVFAIGIVGEYLARVFDEVKARPLFLIAEIVKGNRDETDPPESQNR